MSAAPVYRTVQYVRHADKQRFLDAGWIVSNELAGTHHGFYSVLMEWPHASDPPALER